jgi:hypothetical protein
MSDDPEDRAQESAPEVRKRLGEAIQAEAVEFQQGEDTQRGVVIGWVVIAESVAPDGERWLSSFSGGAGDHALPRWQVQGYAHSLLHDWPTFDETERGCDE